MNTKIRVGLLILVVLIIGVGIFLLSGRASASNDLTSLGPNDAMAYRYTAMAKYFEQQSSLAGKSGTVTQLAGSSSSGNALAVNGYPLLGVDLTTLSPADAMAYRYQALAFYYANHPNATR